MNLKKTVYGESDLERIRTENPDYAYEIIDGQIYMMGLTSADHSILINSISTLLNIQFKGKPCRVMTESMGVKIHTRKNSVLPDVLVVCGKIDPNVKEINNPSLVVEVLSKSTEKYDRGEKLEGYLSLNSLKAYLIVDKKIERVEMYRMVKGEVVFNTFTAGQIIDIEDWVKIPIDDVYEDLKYNSKLEG